MSQKPRFTCPRCQEELRSRKCENEDCQLDLDDLFRDERYEPDYLHRIIESAGGFYDLGTQCVVVPRNAGVPSIEVPMGRQGSNLDPLFWWFVTEHNYSQRRFSTRYLNAYLSVFGAGRLSLPQVDYYGDRPQLYWDQETDRLYWPKPDTVASRLIGPARFFYTGPALEPRRTGLFQEWLDSFKCANPEAQKVLKAWIVGALLQSLMPLGGVPMLFFAARCNGTGKTTAASLLGHFLGGRLLVHWPNVRDLEHFTRQQMDPRARTVIFDNLGPEQGLQMIHAPDMAALITQKELTTKTLYATRGMTVVPNRCLYVATANKPILSCELFSRCVVVPMDAERPNVEGWETIWGARRQELLEDIMAEILENWEKGPVEPTRMPANYRFMDWYMFVSRAMQEEPVLYPSEMILVPPLDYALDVLFHGLDESETALSVDTVVDSLQTSHRRALREVRTQREWTRSTVLKELKLYTSAFELFTNEGGELCVKPRCLQASPKLSSR